MKNLIVVLSMSVLSIGSVIAGNNPDLVKEITQNVKVDLSDIELNKYTPDYVLVGFKISHGEIVIDEITASQTDLKDLIVEELSNMRIESNYNSDKVYWYKFTFEKI